MSKIIDLTGLKFGKWTVESINGKSKDGRITWNCVCDCGRRKAVRGHDLKNGTSKSCGNCKNNSVTNESGEIKRIYSVWASIVQRCENPKSKRYSEYGGRGISMCKEWRNSFSAFEEWAISSGYDENAARGICTIDRIDNNKGYFPDNCRIVNNKIQCNNKRNNRVLEYMGEKHTIAEWSEIFEVPDYILRDRLFRLKWCIDKALETPVRKKVKWRGVN